MKSKSKVNSLTAVIVAFGSLVWAANAATVIYTHSGSADPDTQGWTQDFSGADEAGLTIPEAAWRISDKSTSGGFTQYRQVPSFSVTSDATTGGWELSLRLRVVRSFGGSTPDSGDGIFAGVILNGQAFEMLFRQSSVSDADTIVTLGASSYELEGLGDTYQDYLMVYDPTSMTADVFVNGVERISNINGVASVTADRVAFGASGTATTGSGDFASLVFSTVPEPSTATLLGLACVFGLTRRLRR